MRVLMQRIAGKLDLRAYLIEIPGLLIGSMQTFIITKVKDNPNDTSISMSILVLNPLNGDFDGDG